MCDGKCASDRGYSLSFACTRVVQTQMPLASALEFEPAQRKMWNVVRPLEISGLFGVVLLKLESRTDSTLIFPGLLSERYKAEINGGF